MEMLPLGDSRPLEILAMDDALFLVPRVYEPTSFPPQPQEARDD